jgi:steroid delta-isomerase-like uncharacterized protein
MHQNERLVRQFYAVFSTGDVDILDQILSKDWADRPPIPGQPPGRDGEKATIQAFRIAFPDIQFTLEDVIVAADKVTVRSTARGTHQGEFLGVAPTQRTVSFMTIDIHQIANHQIVETWHLEDFYGLLQQLNSSKLS